MPKLAAALLVSISAVVSTPTPAEPLYDFVIRCRAQTPGNCFHLISERLDKLNAERRVCLPRYYGMTVVAGEVVPTTTLEYIRLRLSAARFGDAGTAVETVMEKIVGALYPCKR